MNVMELLAKISLDSSEYDKGIGEAKGKFDGLGSSLKSGAKKIGGAIGSVASTTLKATGAMIGSATAGVVALTKSAYSAYADYEQLVGGVETLFGSSYSTVEEYAEGTGLSLELAQESFEDYQNRSQKVLENANKAYMTAGLSANEYMEQVTGFSASLNASLGEYAWQSANYADRAITNMADNANKMGTDIESIQNAYAGFAKGNFTMLDNLKLGYGGTASEMERLLRDAEELEGYEVGSLSSDNFADIIEAIDIVQTNLGISGISIEEYNRLVSSGVMTEEEAFAKLGTTAKEASSTLSGSFATMQGAWTNLVANLANPDADLGANIDALVSSAKKLIQNAIPVISQALGGIGQAVAEIIPVIASELPPLIGELLPTILSSATNLVQELASQLPSLLNVLVQQIPLILPSLIETTISVLVSISDALVDALPIITDSINSNISVISSGISKIFSSAGKLLIKLLPSLLPSILKIAVELIQELANGLSQNANTVIQTIIGLVNTIVTQLTNPDTLMQILDCGLQIIFALTEGLLNNLPLLLESVGTLIGNIVIFIAEAIPELVVQIGQFGAKVITDILPTLILNASESLSNLLSNVIGWIGEWAPSILSTAVDVFESIGQGVLDAGSWIWEKVTGLGGDIIDWLWEGLESIGDLGLDIVKGLWQGIQDAGSWLKEKLFGWCDDVVDWCKDGFGIFSPSRRFKYLGRMNAEGLSVGFDDEAKNTFDDMQKTIDDGMEGLDLDPVSLSANSLVTSNLKMKTSSDPISSAMNKLVAMYEAMMENRGEMTFPIIVGGRQIDEVIIDSKNRVTTRSGGQVNA